jgi:two-component system response regulator YesN
VVITDIVMPVMNGAELTKIFKSIRPELKVIGISGFDGSRMVKDARHIDYFIKKPLDALSLIAGVRRMQQAQGTSTSTRGTSLS